MPQLSEALGLSGVGVASLIGLFYYGYSPFGLVSGASIDRLGVKAVIPAAALLTAIGALLFATGSFAAANVEGSSREPAAFFRLSEPFKLSVSISQRLRRRR